MRAILYYLAIIALYIHTIHAVIIDDGILGPETYPHIGATFGPSPHSYNKTGIVAVTEPINLCSSEINPTALQDRVALVIRGECNFDIKVLNAQQSGAIGVIIGDINDYFEQTMLGADYGDTVEQQINIPSIMVIKSTYLHILNLLNSNITVTATLGTDGLLFMPNDENVADDVLSEFAMIYPIMYCIYSIVQWINVFKQNRADERTRQANLAARQQTTTNNNTNTTRPRVRTSNSDNTLQYQQLHTNNNTTQQRNGTTVHNINVLPAVSNSTSTSSLTSLPLGVNDVINDTPHTALLYQHNNEQMDALNEQQRTYNRVVTTLRTVAKLTAPNTMFLFAVVVYSIWTIASAILTYFSWNESDCVISVRWLLVLRMCCGWLSIRHAYSQTHSDMDQQPYLDKAQHLVWWSMIAFNSIWLLMSPVDSHRCYAVAPIAYTSINIMIYITLSWIIVTTILHMLCNSSYISSGLTLVILRGILKYLQLGWIISGALDRPEPVTSLELQYLPTIKYSPGMFVRDGDTDVPSCAICMCEYVEGEQIRQLSCGHHFGKECIDNWLTIKSSCPTCRTSVLSNLTDEPANVAEQQV